MIINAMQAVIVTYATGQLKDVSPYQAVSSVSVLIIYSSLCTCTCPQLTWTVVGMHSMLLIINFVDNEVAIYHNNNYGYSSG